MRKILWAIVLLLLSAAEVHAQLNVSLSISSDSICQNSADSFFAHVSGGSKPYTYSWNFGGVKHIVYSANTAESFSNSGFQLVSLKVTDSKGNSDSVSKLVKVFPAPTASFSVKNHCSYVIFQAVDTGTQTPVAKYLWTGQGSPGYGPLYISGNKGTYLYTRGGMYYYTLTITGKNGCSANYTDSIRIPPLNAVLLPPDTTVCANTVISIKAIPLGGTPPYTIWWGNPGSAYNGDTLKALVRKDTAFMAVLVDSNKCESLDSIKIKALPYANATFSTRYNGYPTTFQTIDIVLKDSAYFWDFGNGQTATGRSTQFTFPSAGTYKVELKVTDTDGCISSSDTILNIIRTFNAFPNPFTSEISITYFLDQNSEVNLSLFDACGKRIDLLSEKQNAGQYALNLDVEKFHLRPGTYHLRFITGDKIITKEMEKL